MKLTLLVAFALVLAPLAIAAPAAATHPCFGPDCGIPHPCSAAEPDLSSPWVWLKRWLTCR